MKFKVGDRVRIVCPCALYGYEATVIGSRQFSGARIWRDNVIFHESFSGLRYEVCVDGVGRLGRNGHPISYEPQHLRPLTPPAQDEWAEQKVKQVTRPTYMEPVRTKEPA